MLTMIYSNYVDDKDDDDDDVDDDDNYASQDLHGGLYNISILLQSSFEDSYRTQVGPSSTHMWSYYM